MKGEDLYELDLNSEITVKLNEYGVERTQEIIQEVQKTSNLIVTEESSRQRIELIKSRIDENDCLTAPLIEVIRQYDKICFEIPIAIVHEFEDNLNDSKSK